MRLFTHNMLSSNIKGVANGFPLRIEVEQVLEKQVDFNPDFLKNLFPKLEWKALVDAARTMGYAELPEEADSSMLESEEFLRKFHHALLELHLEEGALVCPETGRKFPVNRGIPNMLLHEDEDFQKVYHSNGGRTSSKQLKASYCLARAIESFFTCMGDGGYFLQSKNLKRADVVIFSFSTARIMYCYELEREVFQSKYLNVLDWEFGVSPPPGETPPLQRWVESKLIDLAV